MITSVAAMHSWVPGIEEDPSVALARAAFPALVPMSDAV